ncbi:cuticle protein 16.8 [Trichonephila clavipes]|uniref:Cuticle protein 16.8 n=1 Tax=Trichonephila clavipes TaxID=2585209 RepID=A0A8X6RHV8_TRICX|nr:cuticle protein 16.8 [Trichonephila clavipes]
MSATDRAEFLYTSLVWMTTRVLPIYIKPVHHHAPQPYKFGCSVKDKHGVQHREEAGDGHAVRGSYGFSDARGIHRQVNTGVRRPCRIQGSVYAGNFRLGYAGVVEVAPVRYANVVEAPVRYADVVAAPVRYAGVAAAPVGYAGVVTAPIGINGLAGNEVLGYEGYDL